MGDPVLRTMGEDVDGFVYARAGASLPHDLILSNIQGILIPASRGGPCWSHSKRRRCRGGEPPVPDVPGILVAALFPDQPRQVWAMTQRWAATALDISTHPLAEAYKVVTAHPRLGILPSGATVLLEAATTNMTR